jgi:hypothetical protein
MQRLAGCLNLIRHSEFRVGEQPFGLCMTKEVKTPANLRDEPTAVGEELFCISRSSNTAWRYGKYVRCLILHWIQLPPFLYAYIFNLLCKTPLFINVLNAVFLKMPA